VPFIEVGGPGTAVEGSAQVLGTGSLRAAPAAPARAAAADQDQPVVSLPPSEIPGRNTPAALAFQPAGPVPLPLASAEQRFAPSLIAFHQPDHPVSEQYRALLDGLKGQLRTEGSQVVGLLSPVSGTGATTVLLNLAITQARQDSQRVVVVDANLRRPAMAERLGLPGAPGLREVIGRCVPLKRAVRPTGQANCWALTAGEPLRAASRWPGADALRATLEHLREQFDWVLVDIPSWDGGAELVALAAACDGVFLVLRPGDLKSPAVEEIGRLLPPLGSELSGFILTER
jgi:Mrp family chromosome partitioning ATPase